MIVDDQPKKPRRRWLLRICLLIGGLLLLAGASYGWLAWRYWSNPPRPTVDYTAAWNAEVARIPADERAWPKYRPLLARLNGSEFPEGFGIDWIDSFTDADIARWVRQQEPLLEEARKAARLPALGYPLSDVEPEEDFPVDHPHATPEQIAALPRSEPSEFPQLMSVRVLPMIEMGNLRVCLALDAMLAGRDDDAQRATDDVAALLGIARQVRGLPWLIGMLSGLRCYRDGLQAWGLLLEHEPPLLTKKQLLELEKLARAFDFDLKQPLTDERKSFLDVVQRVYTDDGHGDGQFDPTSLPQAMGEHEGLDWWTRFNAPLSAIRFPSRRKIVEEYDRLTHEGTEVAKQPYWKRDDSQYEAALAQLQKQPAYRLATLFLFSFSTINTKLEEGQQQRDAILVASAAMRYRLEHKKWPAKLDLLVPDFLPAIPPDRLTGEPLRYKLVDGRPRIYSIGNDGVDDGGEAALLPGPEAALGLGAEAGAAKQPAPRRWLWELGPADEFMFTGDWVLWPLTADDPFQRPEKKKPVAPRLPTDELPP